MLLALMVGHIYKQREACGLVVTMAFQETGAVGGVYHLSLAVTLWILRERGTVAKTHPQAFRAYTL